MIGWTFSSLDKVVIRQVFEAWLSEAPRAALSLRTGTGDWGCDTNELSFETES